MLSAVILLGAAVMTAVTVVVVGWLGCVHQARAAADLAALAGANARVEGGSPCDVAGDTAARNGGNLISCSINGGYRSFVVKVSVGVALRPGLAAGPRSVAAVAAAGPAG